MDYTKLVGGLKNVKLETWILLDPDERETVVMDFFAHGKTHLWEFRKLQEDGEGPKYETQSNNFQWS